MPNSEMPAMFLLKVYLFCFRFPFFFFFLQDNPQGTLSGSSSAAFSPHSIATLWYTTKTFLSTNTQANRLKCKDTCEEYVVPTLYTLIIKPKLLNFNSAQLSNF